MFSCFPCGETIVSITKMGGNSSNGALNISKNMPGGFNPSALYPTKKYIHFNNNFKTK